MIAARYFVRVMKKVLLKGDAFIVSEIERLGRLIGKESVSSAKKEGFRRRLRVLARFRVRGSV